MILRLERVSEINGATLGVLMFNEWPQLVTLEDAWRDNETNISCIPEGKYKIERVNSPRFGNTFTVKDVPQRSYIRFHWGNDSGDTNGCILIGLKFSPDKKPSIAQSQAGFKRFMDLMSGVKDASIIIMSSYGGGRVH
jgi:hypothetical protein